MVIKEFFMDDGKGDMGTVCVFLCVCAVIFWVSYLVIKTHTMPDLSGPTAFIAASGAVHYASSKVDNVVSAWRGTPNNGPNPQQ